MALPINQTEVKSTGNGQTYLLAFALVTSLFFLWGLANSLNGTLIKHFQTALNLNRFQAGLVDSAFYIGYFVMALPAAFLMNRIGYKSGIIIGLLLYAVGAALFFPAAEVRVYGFFLFALFTIACGLAFLETAANPYVVALGPPSGAERRINFAQSFNGTSIVLGPVIGGLFIFSSVEYNNDMLAAMPAAEAEAIRITEAHSVQTPYLVLSGFVLFICLLFALIKMPKVSDDSEKNASFKGIARHRHLIWGVVAQFFYVGAQASLWGYFIDLKLHYAASEQFGIVAWIYRFTEEMTPTQMAAYHLSFALAMFMIGRFVGTLLLTKFEAAKLLATYAAIAAMLLALAFMSEGLLAVAAISGVNFFMSIMFPTIFSLSIKQLGDQVKLGSGLVIMAIVGGAVMPPITGWLSLSGVQNALIMPFISFLVILYFGLKGYKVKSA